MTPKKKSKQKKLTLEDMVLQAQKEGARISFGLTPRDMPTRFPDDHDMVKLLIAESERCTKLGNDWMGCKNPNPVAGEMLFRHGWAYSLAAAWLRCYLKGELTVKPPEEKKP